MCCPSYSVMRFKASHCRHAPSCNARGSADSRSPFSHSSSAGGCDCARSLSPSVVRSCVVRGASCERPSHLPVCAWVLLRKPRSACDEYRCTVYALSLRALTHEFVPCVLPGSSSAWRDYLKFASDSVAQLMPWTHLVSPPACDGYSPIPMCDDHPWRLARFNQPHSTQKVACPSMRWTLSTVWYVPTRTPLFTTSVWMPSLPSDAGNLAAWVQPLCFWPFRLQRSGLQLHIGLWIAQCLRWTRRCSRRSLPGTGCFEQGRHQS